MVTAVVLIEAETDKINTLAETLVEMNGIKEVFSVAGRYDLIAIVRVQSNEDVADVVSDSMRHL
ncbi:MAG: Lrp/AsnC family transcriptional regulator, partial [Gemmatimonadales bacterium]|nr:Lrp/AsnC family transcriptional regulator [Gemmatimonadales bacterium]